jgi:hypothetical protein
MSRMKEHYHDEISRGMQDNQHYAVTNMENISKALDKFESGALSFQELRKVLHEERRDFEYMHTPDKP